MTALKRKINMIFSQIVMIGLFFLAVLSYLSYVLYYELRIIWTSLLGKLEAVCGCTSHFTISNHPYLFISLIIAGTGILTFISYGIYKIIKLRKTTNRFIKKSLLNKKQNSSTKLVQAAKSLDLEENIIEIKSDQPFVFCYGLLKPRICISSIFVEHLIDVELRAVLLHEQHHLQVYDPTKIFIINLVTRIFFFVPGLNILAKKYFTYSEIAADEWSISKSQGKSPLAKAFYKILAWKEKMAINNLSVPFFNRITEERVNKIVDSNYTFNIRILSPKFLISLFFLISFTLFFSLFIHSSKTAIANHDNNVCSSEYADSYGNCDMREDNIECQMCESNDLLDNNICEVTPHINQSTNN